MTEANQDLKQAYLSAFDASRPQQAPPGGVSLNAPASVDIATPVNLGRDKRDELREMREGWLREAGFRGKREPNGEQWKILRSGKRFLLVSGGERSGKSFVGACYLLMRFAEGAADELYWLAGDDYGKTRAEFEYLVEGFGQLGLLKEVTSRIDPGWIELKSGIKIETKSVKDVKGIAVSAPKGIVVCEAGQISLEGYWKLRGRVAEKRGWMLMSGTMEGSLGWFPKLYTAWEYGTREAQSFALPTWSNVAIFPGGENDPEILKMRAEYPDEFFQERIAGRPSPPRGVVFWEFRPDLHVREEIEWLVDVPVHLWVDPGYAGAAAVEVVQIVGGQVRVIDEIYERLLVTEDIIDLAMRRPWWKGVKFVVGDVAARQHQAMPAVAEVWQARTGLYMSGEKVGIREGIDRFKGYLKPDPLRGQPGLVISPKCRGLISELGGAPDPFDGQTRVYRYKTDREGNVVGDEPEDRWNHGIKAIIYGLVGNFGYVKAMGGDVMRVRDWGRVREAENPVRARLEEIMRRENRGVGVVRW